MESVLETDNLVKYFGKKAAVNGVTLSIAKNKVFGLLGPNGSGKTTTLRLLLSVLVPTSGIIKFNSIAYNGKDENKIKHMIGYVPQKDALYPDLTIWENVDLFFSAFNYAGARRDRIEEAINLVHLSDHKNKLCRDLSGGMLKRASIACAIAHKPEILLFDEISVGLDPQARYQIWDLVLNLKKNSTIIMTTHYMDEAEMLCDDLVIMYEGEVFDKGTPVSLIKKYKSKNLNEVMLKISRQKNVEDSIL